MSVYHPCYSQTIQLAGFQVDMGGLDPTTEEVYSTLRSTNKPILMTLVQPAEKLPLAANCPACFSPGKNPKSQRLVAAVVFPLVANTVVKCIVCAWHGDLISGTFASKGSLGAA